MTTELPRDHQRIRLEARLIERMDVERLELRLDGRLISSFSRPPYATSWALEPGAHELQALAWDRAGAEHRSEAVRFEVLEALPVERQVLGDGQD